MIFDNEWGRKYFLIGCGVALGISILVLGWLYAADSPFRLHVSEARAKLLKGELTTVVDVRSDIEYWAGHYPGSVHIPTLKLLEEAYHTLPNLEEGILVYCESGKRARHSVEVLRSLGYTKAFYVASPYWSLM